MWLCQFFASPILEVNFRNVQYCHSPSERYLNRTNIIYYLQINHFSNHMNPVLTKTYLYLINIWEIKGENEIKLNFQPGSNYDQAKKDWFQNNILSLKKFWLRKNKWSFIPYTSQFRLREKAFFGFAFQVLVLRQKTLTKWKFVAIFPNILDIFTRIYERDI